MVEHCYIVLFTARDLIIITFNWRKSGHKITFQALQGFARCIFANHASETGQCLLFCWHHVADIYHLSPNNVWQYSVFVGNWCNIRFFTRFNSVLQWAPVTPRNSSVYICTHDVIMMQNSSLDCAVFKMVHIHSVVGRCTYFHHFSIHLMAYGVLK